MFFFEVQDSDDKAGAPGSPASLVVPIQIFPTGVSRKIDSGNSTGEKPRGQKQSSLPLWLEPQPPPSATQGSPQARQRGGAGGRGSSGQLWKSGGWAAHHRAHVDPRELQLETGKPPPLPNPTDLGKQWEHWELLQKWQKLTSRDATKLLLNKYQGLVKHTGECHYRTIHFEVRASTNLHIITFAKKEKGYQKWIRQRDPKMHQKHFNSPYQWT